jgi:hypothetical protein
VVVDVEAVAVAWGFPGGCIASAIHGPWPDTISFKKKFNNYILLDLPGLMFCT